MISLNSLIVTQNNLRDYTQVGKMIEFVKAGGKFTRDARLAQSLLADSKRGLPPAIHIADMEDGKLYLHDGHHRAVAMFLGGRNEMYFSEYEIGHYKYSDYSLPNIPKGWLTPFDIKMECRLPDFWGFKQRVLLNSSHKAAYNFIEENWSLYAQPRKIYSITQLAETYTHGTRRI